jgi:SAM-dependent methyltransferase
MNSHRDVHIHSGGTKPHVSGIRAILDDYNISVLEAGAGDSSYFRFPGPVRVTGLDLSPEELASDRFDERILGDVQTHVTATRYDIVMCWTILEHLSEPRKALANLLAWTKPGGLIVLSLPNVWSIKGLVTKFTPHASHKLLRGALFKANGSYEPFPTYLRFAVSPGRIRRCFSRCEVLYEGYSTITLKQPFDSVYQALIRIARFASLGRYDPGLTDFFLVVKVDGTSTS